MNKNWKSQFPVGRFFFLFSFFFLSFFLKHFSEFFSKQAAEVHSPDSKKCSKQPQNWGRTKLSCAIKTAPSMKLETLCSSSTSRSPATGPQAALHTGTVAINLSALEKPPTRLHVKSLPKTTSSMFQSTPMKYQVGNRLIRTTKVSLNATLLKNEKNAPKVIKIIPLQHTPPA